MARMDASASVEAQCDAVGTGDIRVSAPSHVATPPSMRQHRPALPARLDAPHGRPRHPGALRSADASLRIAAQGGRDRLRPRPAARRAPAGVPRRRAPLIVHRGYGRRRSAPTHRPSPATRSSAPRSTGPLRHRSADASPPRQPAPWSTSARWSKRPVQRADRAAAAPVQTPATASGSSVHRSNCRGRAPSRQAARRHARGRA